MKYLFINKLTVVLIFMCAAISHISAVTVQLKINNNSTKVTYATKKLHELEQSHGILFTDNNPQLTVRSEISTTLKPEAYKIAVN